MKKQETFFIETKMPTLNSYTGANRRNRYAGGAMKKKYTEMAKEIIELEEISEFNRVDLEFIWHEKNRRRDPDNVAFGKKFVLDGMVEAGVIENDGWKHIKSFKDDWIVDKERQGVEVIIREVIE